jgi:hypothetical protein
MFLVLQEACGSRNYAGFDRDTNLFDHDGNGFGDRWRSHGVDAGRHRAVVSSTQQPRETLRVCGFWCRCLEVCGILYYELFVTDTIFSLEESFCSVWDFRYFFFVSLKRNVYGAFYGFVRFAKVRDVTNYCTL